MMRFDGRLADRTTVERMLGMVHHRGPDEQGTFVNGPVGLGHARLSIIDLSQGGQPMQTSDGALTVTFNGEIFNYIELRRELEQRGRQFATHSDTEVILHAYAEYGDDCVSHFNGQWAFAVWDQRRQRLFVSRDRLGIRPLHYTVAAGKFLFASEVKSLFADDDVPRDIDLVGLDQVFTFWSTLAPRTILQNINELPPAHNLVVEKGRVKVARYWQLDYAMDAPPQTEEAYAEELLALLTDATRLRLRSDVPVGAYLSGGLDSTVTVALARQSTSAHLRTFSLGFADGEFDESPYQRQVVEAFGTDHQSVRCTYDDIRRIFPEVIWHAERPVLRTAPAPLYLLSQLVREQGYKVVLTGEGADEMLGGYDIFKEAKVRRFCAAQPESTFRAVLLDRLYPYLPRLQAQSSAYRRAFFYGRPEDLASPFFSHLPRWKLTAQIKRFFSGDVSRALRDCDAYEDCQALLPSTFDDWTPFNQSQYLETITLLPGYILSSQGDRMAMAHSVEGRFPFLDYRVAEFAARLPVQLKMRGLREKHLLKQATRRLVPATIRARTKQPYRAPDARSFFHRAGKKGSADYVADMLSRQRIAADGLFNPSAVSGLVQKVRREEALGMKDNMALVGILSTQLLVQLFVHNTNSFQRWDTNGHNRKSDHSKLARIAWS
jgi:asparagine synthase (glutamine-hydrolysing)